MTTLIDLLRHGEAGPGLCMGRDFDAPLTATGWRQMREVLDGDIPNWDGVVSSPLSRCAAFAEEVARKRQLPLRLDSRWRELGFGAWEGQPWSVLYAENGERLLAFQQKPDAHPAPGGEHYLDFETRIIEALTELLNTVQGGHWLLVTHAGVQRTLLRRVLGFPLEQLFSIQIPNACLTRIAQETDGPLQLIFHNGCLSRGITP